MPNRKKRARRREGGVGVVLPVLVVIVAMVAVALVILLINSDPFAPARNNSLPYGYENLNFAEAGDATSAPLVLGTAMPASTDRLSTDASEPTPTAPSELSYVENTVSEGSNNRLVPTPMPGDYFLPVFDKALRTPDDIPMIAITVDGCDNPEVMTEMLNIAEFYGVKLTLFPTGDALMTLGSGFRSCVNTFNYELENCTYEASKKDYALSSGELALQIWRQNLASSYAMMRDYEQHFYRPVMRQSVYDQRTHYYIRKLGFVGIASYTHSYKENDLASLVASLENGNIYQFDMSEKSMALFESFISEASRKGYQLVTMNELFGMEENEISDALTINEQTLPEMNDYTPTYYDLKINYRTNAVYALQTRLRELGYLSAEPGKDFRADGIYGSDTSVAVSEFQARVGLVATGNADVETQMRLFAQDAPPKYG